ncbi:MAG: hypothetical protein Q7V57_05875 [Actinomycetota bacterium]|nr:hypothetical protein [Actinomycetota bacterium]
MTTILAEGMGGDSSSLSTGWIIAIVVGVVGVATLVVRSRQMHAARVRVAVHPTHDAGAVQLHDLPAPGAPRSVALGVRLTPDPAGAPTIQESPS